MSEPTTIPADPIIATTPEPVSETFEQVLSRQINQKPKIDRVDYAALESGEKIPQSLEEVTSMESDEFLKHLDNVDKVEEPKKEKKTKEKVEDKSTNSFDLSDLDLTKEPETAEAPKAKKSKEENIAELRRKAESYEETLKAKDSEVATYREKLEKMEAELERTAFERSPKFKEKYEQPYSEAIEKASVFAKEIGDDQSIAEKALSLKGKERIEFIDENFGGGAASAQFLSLINDADSKRGALEAAMVNHRETANTLVQEEEKTRQQTTEKINKNFERVANHLASKSDFFRKGDDDDHNKVVDERIAAARNILMGTASENDMMVTPFLAVIAKDAVAENAKLKAELAKYKARVSQDTAVSPAPRRGTSDINETTGKPKGAMDSIRSYFR